MVKSAAAILRRGLFQVPGQSVGSGKAAGAAYRPGAPPGIEAHLRAGQEAVAVRITCTDFGEGYLQTQTVGGLPELLRLERPAAARIRWINVDGLDAAFIAGLCKAMAVDTLTAEDILNIHERPKFEAFNDYLLVTLRQVYLADERVRNEKLSLLCFRDTLVSFQEVQGDVFDPVRRRLESSNSRFRSHGPEYLLYALIDSISDHLYPILERYDSAVDALEEDAAGRAHAAFQQQLFSLKRELGLQRRILWAMREVIDGLCRAESPLLPGRINSFLKDLRDQVNHQLDLMENFREACGSLLELYHASASNRLNEIMKVLTIMASFFIPTTFLAGVYGMNFTHIPELDWPYAYPVFWGFCGAFFVALAVFFRRKGWIC